MNIVDPQVLLNAS